PRHRLRPAARQRQALKQLSSPGVHDDRVMTKGSVPGWGKADNNSGSRSRLNDRPPPADFMMARARRAHPKAEYTTATVPLPTTNRSISVLLKRGVHTRIVRPLAYTSHEALKRGLGAGPALAVERVAARLFGFAARLAPAD